MPSANRLAAQHDVDVDAGAHRADTGDPRPVRPGSGSRGSRSAASALRSSGCGRVTPVAGGMIAGAHREHRLDQARGAGGRLGVPDVGLDRTERGDAVRVGAQLGQRVQLGAVGRRGARAVPLDELDVGGCDPGSPVRAAQREELAVLASGTDVLA